MATKKTTNTKTYAPIPEHVSDTDIVMVRNGFYGRLVYVSTRTGERYAWDEYGDELEMEIRDLRSAKGNQKAFFEKNWMMFDEEYSWIIPHLGLTKYYENTLSIEALEDIINKTPSQIKRLCEGLNDGQRESLTLMVRQKYTDGEIDSLKTINALELGLGITLTER